MRSLLLLVALAASAAPALAQDVSTPERAAAKEQLMRTQSSFDVVVRAPYAETAPLFGPEGERAWAGKHWDPHFIHPLPAHDEEDAVFTIQHGPFNAVWVTALYDVEGRHFKYVYFLDNLLVTTIDVRFEIIDAASTRARVVYTRTALQPEGNEHVTAFTSLDKTAGPEWQRAIDAWLSSRPVAAP
jgi:hypothetical protein